MNNFVQNENINDVMNIKYFRVQIDLLAYT